MAPFWIGFEKGGNVEWLGKEGSVNQEKVEDGGEVKVQPDDRTLRVRRSGFSTEFSAEESLQGELVVVRQRFSGQVDRVPHINLRGHPRPPVIEKVSFGRSLHPDAGGRLGDRSRFNIRFEPTD